MRNRGGGVGGYNTTSQPLYPPTGRPPRLLHALRAPPLGGSPHRRPSPSASLLGPHLQQQALLRCQ
jgi:hypothetical protein